MIHSAPGRCFHFKSKSMPSSGLRYSGKPHVMRGSHAYQPALKGKDTWTSPFLNQEDLFHHFPMSYFLGESEAKKLCRFEEEFPQHLSSRTCYTLKSSKCCQIWIYTRIPTQKWHKSTCAESIAPDTYSWCRPLLPGGPPCAPGRTTCRALGDTPGEPMQLFQH